MKKYIVFATSLILGAMVFAQETGTSQIELPDVTTVVNADSLKAGKDTLPDFSDVLDISTDSGAVTVQLPDVDGTNQTVSVVSEKVANEKTVFAEGQFGAGYPHLFAGDFSVYSIALNNPFDLKFSHRSAAGFGKMALSEDYSEKDTFVQLKKQLDVKSLKFIFGGSYESTNFGLQNKAADLTGTNTDLITTTDSVIWDLPHGFSLGSEVSGAVYNRYSDVCGFNEELPSWATGINCFNFAPEVFARWAGYGVNIDVSVLWNLNYAKLSEKSILNRGETSLDVSWENKYVKVYGNTAAVFGQTVVNQPVAVPFTVGVTTNIPVSFANRPLCFNLEGGMISETKTVDALESEYHFTALNFAPTETSNWYGNFKMDFPLKTAFSSSAAVSFSKTAFGNGTYLPDYSAPVNGFYNFRSADQTYLTSDIDFSYHYKIFSVSGGWHLNWIDVPVLEDVNQLMVEFTVQSELSKWGTTVTGIFGLGNGAEAPVLNINGFVKISSAARVIVSAEDLIKLLSGTLRTYAGQYYSTSGSATVMLKFNF